MKKNTYQLEMTLSWIKQQTAEMIVRLIAEIVAAEGGEIEGGLVYPEEQDE